jgi:hypothetical protein
MVHRRLLSLLAAVALLTGVLAVAGSAGLAGPSTKPPTRQEIADMILNSKAGDTMTASAKLGFQLLFGKGQRSGAATQDQLAAAPQPALAQNAAPATPGLPNVRVNNPAEDSNAVDQTTQSETAIAVSGSNVAVGFNDSQHGLLFLTAGANLDGVASSTNGGTSFTDLGWVPNNPGDVNLGDPWLAADGAGNFYYSSLTAEAATASLLVGVSKSTDGGKTWSPLKPIPPPGGQMFYSADKDALTVGPSGTLFDVWDDFTFNKVAGPLSGLPVARSTDGGQSWSVSYASQIPIFPGCGFDQWIGAQPLVTPDGTVYDAAERLTVSNPSCQFPPPPQTQSIWIFASKDGGATWGPGVKIADVGSSTQGMGAFQLGPGKFMRNIEFPTLAARKGKIYAAWNDGTSGHSHIMVGTSADGGTSWTTTAVTSGSLDEAQPALTADNSGVYVLYYQIGLGTNGEGALDAWVSRSENGTSWSAKRVSNQSFPGVFTVPQFDPIIAPAYMGDYIAATSDGSTRYFAWGDNRDVVTNWLWPQGRNDPDVFFAKK